MTKAVLDHSDLSLAAQTGDAQSIERLLAVCQADARRYARRHCHASNVDDAVQETLLTISRKVKGLNRLLKYPSRNRHVLLKQLSFCR